MIVRSSTVRFSGWASLGIYTHVLEVCKQTRAYTVSWGAFIVHGWLCGREVWKQTCSGQSGTAAQFSWCPWPRLNRPGLQSLDAATCFHHMCPS
eukprot:12545948-Alexandrium_andersonii.AAC.1